MRHIYIEELSIVQRFYIEYPDQWTFAQVKRRGQGNDLFIYFRAERFNLLYFEMKVGTKLRKYLSFFHIKNSTQSFIQSDHFDKRLLKICQIDIADEFIADGRIRKCFGWIK